LEAAQAAITGLGLYDQVLDVPTGCGGKFEPIDCPTGEVWIVPSSAPGTV